MYSKKYRVEKIEEFGRHNFIYEDMEDCICYLAYLNVGERGWFLCDYKNDYFATSKCPHRVHTSIVENVEYIDDRVVVTTENTKLTFRVEG